MGSVDRSLILGELGDLNQYNLSTLQQQHEYRQRIVAIIQGKQRANSIGKFNLLAFCNKIHKTT